jgi:TonB family protein
MRPAAFAMLLAVLTWAPAVTHASPDEWPSKIVKLEELHALTKFELRVPGIVVKGRISGPSVIKAHVAADGSVMRTALLSSCGNADLDEASLHAMSDMRFEPYVEDNGPVDVSLVLPIHVPKRLGRRD